MGGQGAGPPLKNHKNIGFLSNTGTDLLKITKLPSHYSMFNVGPLSARQRNAILMAFSWRADDGTCPLSPHRLIWTKPSGKRMGWFEPHYLVGNPDDMFSRVSLI